jgi:hypothetical protein
MYSTANQRTFDHIQEENEETTSTLLDAAPAGDNAPGELYLQVHQQLQGATRTLALPERHTESNSAAAQTTNTSKYFPW